MMIIKDDGIDVKCLSEKTLQLNTIIDDENEITGAVLDGYDQ